MATITQPLPVRSSRAAGVLHLWHLSSLDAVTVAVCWTLSFARAVDVHLPWWPPAVVGLSAWSFYIADRLFDAYRARTPLRLRHYFHWQHRRVFVPVTVVCATAALALVLWKMPWHTELRDSLVAAAAIAYFAGVHRPELSAAGREGRRGLIPKELLVAIVFTAACAAPAVTRSAERWMLLAPLVFFTILAWLNCYAIERWESHDGGQLGQMAQWLAGTAIAGGVVAMLFHATGVGLLFLAGAASAVLLGFLDRHCERLEPTSLRALADLVLLTPLILVMMR